MYTYFVQVYHSGDEVPTSESVLSCIIAMPYITATSFVTACAEAEKIAIMSPSTGIIGKIDAKRVFHPLEFKS